MFELVQAVLRSDEKSDFRELIAKFRSTDRKYLLRNEILQAFEQTCQDLHKPPYFFHSSRLGELIHLTHEILLENESLWIILRDRKSVV